MLISDQKFEFIFGACFFVDLSLKFLQRALDLGGLVAILLLKLIKSQLVHLPLNEHQNFVDLLDEIHFLDHFSLFDLLDI